jgi:hypothetical protein
MLQGCLWTSWTGRESPLIRVTRGPDRLGHPFTVPGACDNTAAGYRADEPPFTSSWRG